jgi:hypothetical protein
MLSSHKISGLRSPAFASAIAAETTPGVRAVVNNIIVQRVGSGWSFTSVGCAQQFLLELRRRRTFRARAVSQTSIQMMRPDELLGKDKGSLRREFLLSKSKGEDNAQYSFDPSYF